MILTQQLTTCKYDYDYMTLYAYINS